MRLTPSWLRSSSNVANEEQFGETDTSSGVNIYYNSAGDTAPATEAADEATAADFVPESDATLLAALEGVTTPATVDSIVDELVEPANPPIETWATVHEWLHEDRLPALDETGAIDFDPERGTVETVRYDEPNGTRVSTPLLGLVFVGCLSVLLVAWMTSVMTALTFTFVVLTVVAWFVPVSGFV